MNRKLLATLLEKNIDELNMITNSFMELNEYPLAIIHLAKRKTQDIEIILDQLSKIKNEIIPSSTPDFEEVNINEIPVETKLVEIIADEAMDTAIEKPDLEEAEIDVKSFVDYNNSDKDEVMTKPVVVTAVVEPEIVTESELEFEPVSDEENVSVETFETTEVSESVEEFDTIVLSGRDTMNANNAETHERTTIIEESKVTTIADRITNPSISRNEVMSKADNSISASIANRKISDIKQAISIGDRFRFQRELFKGNGEDMNKTLNYINQLATQEEIISFLQSKYKWDSASESAEDFYQIVRRKFL